MAVTRLAWRQREHTWDPHVEDDRVQKEGALQPRLVPLRVHKGGVHGVEQDAVDVLEEDAVDVLHCGSTQKTAAVLVTVRASKKKSDRKIIMAIFWNSGVFCRILVVLTGIGGRNKKRRLVIILAPMVVYLS